MYNYEAGVCCVSFRSRWVCLVHRLQNISPAAQSHLTGWDTADTASVKITIAFINDSLSSFLFFTPTLFLLTNEAKKREKSSHHLWCSLHSCSFCFFQFLFIITSRLPRLFVSVSRGCCLELCVFLWVQMHRRWTVVKLIFPAETRLSFVPPCCNACWSAAAVALGGGFSVQTQKLRQECKEHHRQACLSVAGSVWGATSSVAARFIWLLNNNVLRSLTVTVGCVCRRLRHCSNVHRPPCHRASRQVSGAGFVQMWQFVCFTLIELRVWTKPFPLSQNSTFAI